MYKFLRLIDGQIRSTRGDCEWQMGEWQSNSSELVLCENGFHCSRTIYHAFSYVQGEILAEVEVGGKCIPSDDKEVWQSMRLVRAWYWRKEDSVDLAIFAANLVLENYEKLYPEDERPRKAIEAAIRWRENTTETNRLAAWSAAWSAQLAAQSAAQSAAWSAVQSAAWSAAALAAQSAARSAAWSAELAARLAQSAAWSAAGLEGYTIWMENHLSQLETYPRG